MEISACIIAKNEEKNIARCLDSIKSFVDEIIVVDTGSTDSTIEIAKSFDSKVFNFTWNNDFSAARNYAIDHATKDWILIIDCDEVVCDDSKDLIKDLSDAKGIDGFGVSIINIINGIESYNSGHLRFFKNVPMFRYSGIIHEQIGHMLNENGENPILLKSDIRFFHYGYDTDSDTEKIKIERNLKLLNLVDESKRDGMYYLHLGAEYTRIDDFKKACETYIKGFNISDRTQPFFTQLAQKTVASLCSYKDFEKCVYYCDETLKDFIDFKSIYFVKAASCIELKRYKEALSCLKIFKSIKDTPFKYPILNYESNNDIDGLIKTLESLNL